MTGMAAPQGAPAAGYQVVSGDTLGEIAATHGTDVSTLLQLNPHLAQQDPSGNLIHVGQQVALPGGTPVQVGAARPGKRQRCFAEAHGSLERPRKMVEPA